MFNFEKLEVWNHAVSYATDIYRVTRAFPPEERFGLTNQMRRSAHSIAANIAEGAARPKADNLRFLGYASGSLFEVVTQATIARNVGYIATEDFDRLRADAERISRMLSGLRRSLAE